MANTTPVTFVPQISPDVPWHTRQHIQLLYQKLANHTLAFANLAKTAGGTVSTTTIENVTQGGGGGGGGGPIPGLGGVNNQTGFTAYTTTVADNGVTLILDDASPVAVTLNSGVSSPWMIFATNLGTGLVTLTPTTGTINSAASFALPPNYSSLILFDGTNWWALAMPVVPVTITAVPHQWLNSYNSVTGLFTQTQPTAADVVSAYGNMNAFTVGLVVTIAVSGTFYPVTSSITGGATSGFTFQSSQQLQCNVAGTYLIQWTMSLDAASSNQEVAGAIMINGTADTTTACHTQVITSGREQALGGSGIITLAVNDIIQISVANLTGTANVIFDDLCLSVLQIA